MVPLLAVCTVSPIVTCCRARERPLVALFVVNTSKSSPEGSRDLGEDKKVRIFPMNSSKAWFSVTVNVVPGIIRTKAVTQLPLSCPPAPKISNCSPKVRLPISGRVSRGITFFCTRSRLHTTTTQSCSSRVIPHRLLLKAIDPTIPLAPTTNSAPTSSKTTLLMRLATPPRQP